MIQPNPEAIPRSMGESLSKIYPENPEKVDGILEYFRSRYKSTIKGKQWKEATHNEALLATVVLTYGYISYDKYTGNLNLTDAFEVLWKIFDTEKHPYVQSASVEAITNLLRYNFNDIEEKVLHLINTTEHIETRDQFLRMLSKELTKIYLHQRDQLDGFDKRNSKMHKVWAQSIRPQTSVEEILLRWFGNTQNPMGQRLSTRTWFKFASYIDIEEEELAEKLNKTPQSTEPESVEEEKNELIEKEAPKDTTPYLSTLDRQICKLSIIISNPKKARFLLNRYLETVYNILPELLIQQENDRSIVDFVVKKRFTQGEKERQELSKIVGKFLFLKNNWWIIITSLFVVIISYFLLSS